MRIALIHSDFLEYVAKKKTDMAEEITDDMRKAHFDEALVCFAAIEESDKKNYETVKKKVSDEIDNVFKQVKAERIVLYPYVHLLFGAKPSDPQTAVNLLKDIESELKSRGYDVYRTPFGWYKAFTIKCKGHPLSELTRIITGEDSSEDEVVSNALKSEEKAKSTLYIITPDGELVEAENFDFSNYPELRKFYNYEKSGVRSVDRVPPHVTLMRRLEIADYEEGSDSGNLKWYPKGELIKNIIEDYITNKILDIGGMPVETPLMYDYHHPALEKYMHRFPARQYTLKSGDKEYFMRFAACFGQFLMKRNMTISYKNLPLKMYELTHYSFRREQKGELVGLRRLRSFTMPDMHTLCMDMEMAKEEFKKQYEASREVMKDLGIDYQVAFRIVRDFYEKNREFIHEMVKSLGKPALIEIWDNRFFYFILKFEFNFIDALDKASALSTVQIDVENSERFDITYTDSNNQKKHPLLLHCSISGAVERDIYALLETAYMVSEKGGIPALPLWLAPTQVRIIPVAQKHLEDSVKIADELKAENIRVDIDDREETVGKRIRDAEREWIPYIIVYGDNESTDMPLPIRIRGEKEQVSMTVSALTDEIRRKTEGKPVKRLYLPMFISKRPIFV